MKRNYIEKRDGGYWIAGTRISLDSIVIAFKRGASPETIKRSFPLLSLEEVYGTLTFYLANQTKIESYLRESEEVLKAEADERGKHLRKAQPNLIKRLQKAKRDSGVTA